MKRRGCPQRRVADETLVARPSDGTPVLLNPVVTVIWDALIHWQDTSELVAVLARQFPAVSQQERRRAIREALALLAEEDLIERA